LRTASASLLRTRYLQLVAKVDDESVWQGADGDPLVAAAAAALLEDLKAGDVGVLEEDGEGVGIRVLRQTVGEVGFRALRVVVHRHMLLLLAEGILDVVLREAQAEGDHAEQPDAEQPDLAAVRADYLPAQNWTPLCQSHHSS
jgi:hypothetical protein